MDRMKEMADGLNPIKDDEGGDAESAKDEVEEMREREADEQARKQKLEAGDYVVQVHLIEGRDLKGRGRGDMSDPVCEVECLGQKQTSRKHKRTLNPMFEQVLYFEYPKSEPAEIESGRVRVSVYDANAIMRNVLIGMFEFDLATVYYMKHHEMFRQWVALTDVTDEHEGIQGYLKLSIVVLGPKDEQKVHTAEEEDDEEEGMLSVMMPPQIEQTGRLLKINTYEADGICEMDDGLLGGKADPYGKVQFAGIKLKTKHVSGQSVAINQSMLVPVMEPILGTRIMYSLYDWDAAGSDDRICTTLIDYKELKEQPMAPRWLHLYGAPEGKQRGVSSKMNRGYVEGSFWRGRVLLSASVSEVDEPRKDVVDCSPVPRPKTDEYVIEFDLYEGAELPDKNGTYVEIGHRDRYFRSDAKDVEEARATWYEPILDDGEKIVVTAPQDLTQCADIYVYLCHKKRRLSFVRIPFKAAVEKGWKVPPTWTTLKEDRATDYLDADKGEFPGALLFSLRVGKASTCPPEPFPEARPLNVGGVLEVEELAVGDDIDEDVALLAASGGRGRAEASTAVGGDNVPTVGNLQLTVIGGRDLPVMDRKSSDPYVKLRIGNQKFQTKVIKESLNPEWNETFEFKHVPVHSDLHLEMFDRDMVGKDDLMGYVMVDVRTQQTQSRAAPGNDFAVENWFLINDEYPSAAVQLRFVFTFLSVSESRKVEERAMKNAKDAGETALDRINIFKKIRNRKLSKIKKQQVKRGKGTLGEPEFEQFQLRAHIYQARGLPAVDANGLADPYVIVRLCGKKIRTRRKNETVNPQWYQSLSVNLDLPTPLALAPKIQVSVFDWDRLSSDDVMGRFEVELDDALTDKKNEEGELVPTWYDLFDFDDRQIEGARVLACFELLRGTAVKEALPDITPPTIPMFIEVTTLGLRNLTSLLGVHKTFVEFELPNGKRFKTNKSNSPESKNPNMLQVLKIPVDLPLKRIFAPFVDIEVKDTLFGGLVKRLIGVAALDLGEFMMDEHGHWATAAEVEVLDEDALFAEIDALGGGDDGADGGDEIGLGLVHDGGLSPSATAEETEEEAVEESTAEKKPLVVPASRSHHGSIELMEFDKAEEEEDDDEEKKEEEEEDEAKKDEVAIDVRDDDFADTTEEVYEGEIKAVASDDDEEEDEPEWMKGRRVVDDELEDVVAMEPFLRIPLSTGQANAGVFQQGLKHVGDWKGLIRLIEDPKVPPAFDQKEFLVPQDLFLRLYVIRGVRLTPKDSDGFSDPYLRIKVGKTKISTRDRYIKDTLEPDFYESFEIPIKLPGTSTVKIDVYDYDGVGDDLIGSTEIDVEDRWFTPAWRAIEKKPVESRTLHTKTSNASQGKLQMWMEVLTPQESKRQPLLNIKPPPPTPHELRVIVWNAKDCVSKESITEGQNDLYCVVKTNIPSLKPQKTDVHWRAKNGKGSWNWRCKFPVDLPLPRGGPKWPRVNFSVFDRDIITANDTLGESTVSLKGLCKAVMRKKDSVKMIVEGKERFWLDLHHANFGPEAQGRLEVSFELVPMEVAAQMQNGQGRSEPNMYPVLPEPEGRLKWTLNPFTMLRQILGDRLCAKLVAIVCVLLLGAAISFIGPMIVSSFVTKNI